MNLLGYNHSKQIENYPNLGSVFETYVGNAVRAFLSSQRNKSNLFHWREKEKKEVDLILELSPKEVLPIEIKLTSKPNQDDYKNLLDFIDNFQKVSKIGILISTHEECFWIHKKILHLPCWIF